MIRKFDKVKTLKIWFTQQGVSRNIPNVAEVEFNEHKGQLYIVRTIEPDLSKKEYHFNFNNIASVEEI